jgi:hypothetical protein
MLLEINRHKGLSSLTVLELREMGAEVGNGELLFQLTLDGERRFSEFQMEEVTSEGGGGGGGFRAGREG